MFEEKVMHSFSSRKGPSEHLALWKSSGQFKAALCLSIFNLKKMQVVKQKLLATQVRDKASELGADFVLLWINEEY